MIVTIPTSILRGNGYSINFQPIIDIQNLPYYGGQFNKVFVQFNHNFWSNNTNKQESNNTSSSNNNKQYIGILRESQYRGVCNHWLNFNSIVKDSNTLLCFITTEGMQNYIRMNLTENDLLDPLRIVYGIDIVNDSYEDIYMTRWDLDPSSGYAAYSSFTSGYTYNQSTLFFGGWNGNDFVEGVGYNNNANNEWIVHISGAASCFNYNEQVDGAYYSGIRSARYVLFSLGYTNIQPIYDCEAF